MAKKTVNSDIYNVSGLIDDLKSIYLPDEDEETLAVGMYGYIGAINSRRLQTQVEMTGELSNEIFPSRARLERNIISHAIIAGIEDINAIPAKMSAFIAIKEEDVLNLLDADSTFTIDRECPIYIGDYEFHLEYDVILKKVFVTGSSKSAYTAMYDIPEDHINPSSTIENKYLSAPAIINLDSKAYIYITVTLAQVIHNRKYEKVVTSSVIDNKTLNFEFDDQLAYFEVHSKEADEDYWITPIFEGSTSTDNINTKYYCWYQYIDTNLIRIRFESGSYIPNLSAEVEVLYKTTKGLEGNFKYSEDVAATLESENYGYKGLEVIVTPITDSKDGKDRKSKAELQGLIPKETFARGSLTTITDLDNYFSMLDSDFGRIKIQKKKDNQLERVYYAYYVAKDQSYNVIPSNTINIKVPIEELVSSQSLGSESERLILKPGALIRLDENGQGYISHDPLPGYNLAYNAASLNRGKLTTAKFKVKITDDSYDSMSVKAYVFGAETVELRIPSESGPSIHYEESTIPEIIEDYAQISVGGLYDYTYEITADGSALTITDNLPSTLVFSSAYYSTAQGEFPLTSASTTNLSFNIPTTIQGLKYTIHILLKVAASAASLANNTISNTISVAKGTATAVDKLYTNYVPTISQNPIPSEIEYGTEIEYTVKYKSTSISTLANFKVDISRGFEYKSNTSSFTYEDVPNPINIEPTITNTSQSSGFLYTNPYSLVINKYHLYSAFYMMAVDENPYIYFKYVNMSSNAQFISTSIYWNRPFLGMSKDDYTLSITLTQSVQEDIGLTSSNVKCVVAFLRDGAVYKYRTLDLISNDATTYSYTFSKTFRASDALNDENRIMVYNVEDPGYMEDEETINGYGFFDANTDIRIYALCGLPDSSGNYSRGGGDYPIDGFYSPTLTNWTVTNIFSVPNNINFYYNYSEIMNSKVIAYGDTVTVGGEPLLDIKGYVVKSVPVLGYDYCQDEETAQTIISDLNYRKAYIDNSLKLLENTFGVDFKLFNTYGPSNTYYIIKDRNNNKSLDDVKEYLDRTNLTMNFRVKLVSDKDSYTINNIKTDIKEYVENFDNFGDLHIPNLISTIMNAYSEQIVYIEFLGFNDYGPDIQHLYKDEEEDIDINATPEFLNVNSVKDSLGDYVPDINIYISNI